jgi:hypothetical protein
MADLAKINYETVRNLELLVPSVEVSSLNSLVSSGQVLSEFSPVQRKQILLRLRSFDDRIPSLFSFFEDFKCFEKWAHCVHRLFELNGHTVRQRMDREWRPRSFYIETGENAYSEGNPAIRLSIPTDMALCDAPLPGHTPEQQEGTPICGFAAERSRREYPS